MDASQVIQRDHREIERLLKALERVERTEERERDDTALRAVVKELSLHAVIEEQFLYPALREAGARREVLDAIEEHHAVKVLLAELEELPPASERFLAKARLLAEQVRRHVEEEERTLLPLLERSLDDERRRALGESLERARRVAPTRPHPEAPDTPPGNFVAGAVAAVLDRSRDALRAAVEVVSELAGQGARVSAEAARRLARRARTQGGEAVNGTLERGRGAIDGAMGKGRAAVEEALERGREAVAEATGRTREAASRVELRGAQAAREVGQAAAGRSPRSRTGAQKPARTQRASARRKAGKATPARRQRRRS